MPTLPQLSRKSPLRSNREHYLRLRKWQFIGSRNLYDFCRQPYAVWLRHGPPDVLEPVALLDQFGRQVLMIVDANVITRQQSGNSARSNGVRLTSIGGSSARTTRSHTGAS